MDEAQVLVRRVAMRGVTSGIGGQGDGDGACLRAPVVVWLCEEAARGRRWRGSRDDGATWMRDGRNRRAIRPGLRVAVVRKEDQRTGKRTLGTVKDILTASASHPHGIKVRLADGQIGRVQEILSEPTPGEEASRP